MGYDTREWKAGSARADYAGRTVQRAAVWALNTDGTSSVVAELPGDRWITDLIARQIVAEHAAARDTS